MFTLLLSIIFYNKPALSSSYEQQFNEVVVQAENGIGHMLLPQRYLTDPIYIKDICDANDEKATRTDIPKQVCAEKCFNAPYFCTSFLLGFQDHKLKCLHYAIKAASVQKNLREVFTFDGLPVSFLRLDSLYEIKNEPDFVTTVAEISKTLINHPLNFNDWKDIVQNYYTNPESIDFSYVARFGRLCQNAIPYGQIIDSISEKQTLRLGSLDRKSFILALKKFHSSNPEYSPDFDKIALIFLKWFGPENCNFSDSHYLAIDPLTENRIFVHSFSSGHYVTITRAKDGYDHITYISAGGSFDQVDSNREAAISKYLQNTDSLLQLTEGTTELSPDPEEEYEDDVDMIHFGSTKAEHMQQTAIAIVGRLAAALLEKHVDFEIAYDATLLRDLITLVLSWAYKVRQSDFNMLEEAEILNRGSKMTKTLFTGFSPDSILNIITQH